MRGGRSVRVCVLATLLVLGLTSSANAVGGYAQSVTDTPGLLAYWRLGEPSGTTAADVVGRVPGSFVGGVDLGARGALDGDPDAAARFDGVDDELQAGGPTLALSTAGTVEGWFFWEAGVALMRDSTGSAGWILAFDSGGKVAYRVGGTTFATSLLTAAVRDAWHHVAVTVAAGTTAFYLDGALVHTGTAAGGVAAAPPWRVMHNGSVAGQFTRGRADEVALYDRALDAETLRSHFLAGRDVTDATAPAAPAGVTASARFGRVELSWSDSGEPDADGYDVFRATSATGPFTRVNGSRLARSGFTDTQVTGGTSYVYVVTASDVAGNRSANSVPVAATPPSTTDLLRLYSPELRYETQETYFADSAAEMTDNFTSTRQNHLVGANGVRLAASNPASALADLSLGFLGHPLYADGRAAADADHLDAANTSYQQDAQRMRAAGYADRVYGRVATSGGRTFLQYWLFYYYNPQNVLGFGVHEGDWEFAQIALDGDGVPTAATYAQHGDGERCAWSRVRRTSAGAPVLYVALASHASYFSSGVATRGLLPDDHHRGGGYRVRPQLEVVTPSTPFMAWRGRWGGSSSSPVAPRRQGSWLDPAGFEATAAACTVPTDATAATRRAGARSGVPAPRVKARRVGAHVVVKYRFPATRRRPASLLVSVAQAGALDVATARRLRLHGTGGTVRLTPSGSGPFVVQASAFSPRGTRSAVARADVR